ncbi:polyprenyl synthetase family protein [Phreatobacter cathodiphilus]|uniref:Probable farnesyl diphosphate synthase n=1 Tax=Phreatobacter cathodiphilus TaxID=1868589 RepID=A0A2S0NGR7_9HYPH|nr:farnesyl diphosphate synthase [Phreatobacter cathodiphilus]AVO47370.1 geranylgeranyl pyrophosphate synthase [Phreatobacter cathodiphilus]
MPPATRLEDRLAAAARLVEAELATLLHDAPRPGEMARPARLIGAMRHGVLAGGKRLRPFLVIECAALFGVPVGDALPTAAALELVHCYSLVHDDLPAMDDDDLRRGRPTVHKAYDEATAILVGDGLLTLAFETVAAESAHPDPAIRAELTVLLARAAGLGGMVGGQLLDLAAEGRFDGGAPLDLAEADIRRLQAMKTGALIRFACLAGAVLGGASQVEREALVAYGEIIGLAFQVADDLIDHDGDAALAGKAIGKDAARGKGTLVSLHGPHWARDELTRLVDDAAAQLVPFGGRAAILAEAAGFIARRQA